MIERRALLKAATAGAAALSISPMVAIAASLPADPDARLVWLKRQWLNKTVKHEWRVRSDGYSYAGVGQAAAGFDPRHLSTTDLVELKHRQILGHGETAIEAVDDWYANLPVGKFHAIFWRVKPELSLDRDFDTKKTKYRVWSLFSLMEKAPDGVSS